MDLAVVAKSATTAGDGNTYSVGYYIFMTQYLAVSVVCQKINFDICDAPIPMIEEGGVSVVTGNHKSKSNVFYIGIRQYNDDWVTPQDDALWNSGTEDNPVKTEYDPCPEGWRVPTYAEFNNLGSHYSSWTAYDGQNGCWFSGSSVYSESASRVFFPAAGYLTGGYTHFRGRDGFYWSSGTCRDSAFAFFSNGALLSGGSYRETGFSVRCVQVTD